MRVPVKNGLYGLVLAALVFLVALIWFTPVAGAAIIDCDVVGVCEGTDFDDDISGTGGYDEIRAREGDDFARGGGSGDDIFGGVGADVLKGGGGDDAVHGSYGNDTLRLASDDQGGDFADCGDGDDEVFADPGDAVDPDCETVHYVF